ncbi:hypothetical protein C4D60_Mb08t15100 [Musa balbisiana]|uniref:Uncharacterized protein n=1 Tax=Musa balbisiana TaxID=52838 RepID=A0A4S8K3X6_MUSBA|nr:hypothetical protein C4D60_Mb08t15100 [Musa balbisiana]
MLLASLPVPCPTAPISSHPITGETRVPRTGPTWQPAGRHLSFYCPYLPRLSSLSTNKTFVLGPWSAAAASAVLLRPNKMASETITDELLARDILDQSMSCLVEVASVWPIEELDARFATSLIEGNAKGRSWEMMEKCGLLSLLLFDDLNV